MDTAGAWLIERLVSTARAKGIETRIEGQNEVSEILLGAVGDAAQEEGQPPRGNAAELHHPASSPRSASASTRCATTSSPP